MFTLKFIKNLENNPDLVNPCNMVMRAFCCDNYSVHEYDKFIEVTVPQQNDSDMVIQIANKSAQDDLHDYGLRQDYQNVCYVENANGKTIDVIRKMA